MNVGKIIIIIILSVFSVALASVSECTSYTPENLTWKDISHGQKFYNVATNPGSRLIWAVMRKSHSSGKGY